MRAGVAVAVLFVFLACEPELMRAQQATTVAGEAGKADNAAAAALAPAPAAAPVPAPAAAPALANPASLLDSFVHVSGAGETAVMVVIGVVVLLILISAVTFFVGAYSRSSTSGGFSDDDDTVLQPGQDKEYEFIADARTIALTSQWDEANNQPLEPTGGPFRFRDGQSSLCPDLVANKLQRFELEEASFEVVSSTMQVFRYDDQKNREDAWTMKIEDGSFVMRGDEVGGERFSLRSKFFGQSLIWDKTYVMSPYPLVISESFIHKGLRHYGLYRKDLGGESQLLYECRATGVASKLMGSAFACFVPGTRQYVASMFVKGGASEQYYRSVVNDWTHDRHFVRVAPGVDPCFFFAFSFVINSQKDKDHKLDMVHDALH